MPSAAKIEAWRRRREQLTMPSTGTIAGDTLTGDGRGGFTSAPGATTTTKCRLRAVVNQGQERVIADRLAYEQPYAIDLPVTTMVRASQRITIGGRTFEIGGIVDAGDWALVKVAVVKEST